VGRTQRGVPTNLGAEFLQADEPALRSGWVVAATVALLVTLAVGAAVEVWSSTASYGQLTTQNDSLVRQRLLEERPFDGDSPWNVPIPDDPVVDPGSAAMISNLVVPGRPPIANLYDFGLPIYEADARTPRHRIRCTEPWGTCDLEEVEGGVPIPDGARANPGSDAAISVVDRAQGRVYCLWRYNNDYATTAWGHVYDLHGLGDGRPPVCTGSGLPGMGGVVRLAEMKAGEIPHALVFSTMLCGSGVRYPAGKSDGSYTGRGALPEGARLQLDPAVDVDAIPGITPGERAVARALQVYGAYAGDCGGAKMAFTFEHPKGGEDPYPSVGFQWDYFGMSHIPWERMRVLGSWTGR
jgi:hypothetical protein